MLDARFSLIEFNTVPFNLFNEVRGNKKQMVLFREAGLYSFRCPQN